MHTTDSPERRGAPAAQQAHPQNANSNNDAQLLLDGDPVFNRQLVRVWEGVPVYEVTELRVSCYEVETVFETFRFSRLYEAIDKQVRLTEERSRHDS
jgi:hypothetical protein